MTVELWLGQEFETPHEREDFYRFVRDLEVRFGQSDKLYLILANYYIGGRQVDLTVLKNDAIILIELKRCAAPFWATENGPWRIAQKGGAIVGSGDQNPYEQVRDYRFKWINLLESNRQIFPPGKAESMNLYHVSAFVAISPALHPRTENHLSTTPWFRLVGLDGVSAAVQEQTSPWLNFSDDELRSLASDVLNLTRRELVVPQERTTSTGVGLGGPGGDLPRQIGRYQPQAFLGRGGMGTVYQAYDPHLNREVVLKLIDLPDPAKGDEFHERFRREVQAAGQLNHPNIVTVYDVNLDHQPPYVVMELLSGGTLQDRLRSGPLNWEEGLSLLRPLVEALAYAHRVGVIHRDVKPANVLFGGEANVLKLVDFGLARWLSSAQITHSGMVVGTPAYMSPEQARGELVDARADIFSLGVILFETITGVNPLLKETLTSTLLEAVSEHEIDLSSLRDRAPEPVIKLIGRAVARDRNYRYPTCEALLADLDRSLPDLTTIAMFPPVIAPAVGDPPAGPDIRQASDINLSTEIITVLRTMFSSFSRVAVETEFERGFSGSHVFQVRLVEAGDKPQQLPAVVKIAPISLIHKEVQAYQTWVENRLPNIARLDLAYTCLADSPWGGLRYALVGGGTFEAQSLYDFCQTANIDDVCWVLEGRLFEIMGQNWWLDNRIDRAFQMHADYDTLLPFNLLIKAAEKANADTQHFIGRDTDPARISVQAGRQIQLQGFVITKVDPDKKHVTLNLPSRLAERPLHSYQVRLIDVPDTSLYQVGNMVDVINAEVVATRHDLLTERVRRVFGDSLDPAAEQLNLAGGGATTPRLAPNPLLTYHGLLYDFFTVKLSTIHGDLNMENILVDPATGEVSLIDFATVRQGHVLHDLLRLETEVVIKLIPPTLRRAGLPSETIFPFYELLHRVTAQPGQPLPTDLPWPTLIKPFKVSYTIRQMARKCLFNLDDWREYYRGLTLYLLGVLKFDTLDRLPTAPLPAQTAFWGATAANYLFDEAGPQKKRRKSKPVPLAPQPIPAYEIEPPYGTMHPRSQFYIERTADQHCLERLNRSQAVTLFIQAPRQMGKSSLMRRALYQAKSEQNKPFIFIDFQRFPEQHFNDEESFLIELCSMISDALGLPEAIDRYWQGRRTNIMKCSRYVAEYVIPQINVPFVLAMDEVERMLTSPFRSNFFGMLRTWHNDRVYDNNLARLTLFLSSSTEPYLFIDNPNQSPFNVAEVFSLRDFTLAEVEELNHRHRSPLTQTEVLDLMELANGHPFLTRLALFLLATGKWTDYRTLAAQAAEDSGPFGDHLRYYLLRVLQQADLKQALARIVRDHTFEENQLYYRLKGAGLIKKEGKRVVFRNNLYDRYFKERLNG